MPLRLPTPDDRKLARSPLAVVVFQVRFEQNLSVGDGDTGLRLYEHLGGPDGRYPRVEPLQMLSTSIQLGPMAPVQSQGVPTRGLRLRDEAGTLVFSLMPDSASLETTAYGMWKGDFRECVREALDALQTVIGPRVEERLGLRYVNRIVESDVSSPADFQEIISPELFGPGADEFWGPGITGLQQQLEIDLDDDIQCLLRHGTLTRSSGIGIEGYLLDLDLFRQQPRRFTVDDIVATSDILNDAATALFQKSLTASYLDILRKQS